MTSSIALYRNCKIGETLKQSLKELSEAGKIPDDLSDKILSIFDTVMCEEIPKKPKNKCSIKGKVKTYKHCDDIWIFTVDNVYLRSETENFQSEKLRVVACDYNMKHMYDENKILKKKKEK